ncbi:MAG: hypothetical protein R3F60_01625 [bacterium]
MEFYVVDPKDYDFSEWAKRIREFLKEEKMEFTEEDGGLYYIGDDVATPWAENSLLFTVEDDDQGGVIELRDVDTNFYTFSDDLSLFEDREVKEAVGLIARSPRALYGFRSNDTVGCRFHRGPSRNLHFFCEDQEADYPHAMALEDVWSLFFRVVNWLSGSTSRIQDFKGINVEKVHLDFEVEVEFTHPSCLDPLLEILADEDNPDVRTRSGLRGLFHDRDLTWIRRFVKALPPEEEYFESAIIRAKWWGTANGERVDIFNAGVERRELRPFIQIPVHRTAKELVDKFRAHFKGHRIDRQEYYLEDD